MIDNTHCEVPVEELYLHTESQLRLHGATRPGPSVRLEPGSPAWVGVRQGVRCALQLLEEELSGQRTLGTGQDPVDEVLLRARFDARLRCAFDSVACPDLDALAFEEAVEAACLVVFRYVRDLLPAEPGLS